MLTLTLLECIHSIFNLHRPYHTQQQKIWTCECLMPSKIGLLQITRILLQKNLLITLHGIKLNVDSQGELDS